MASSQAAWEGDEDAGSATQGVVGGDPLVPGGRDSRDESKDSATMASGVREAWLRGPDRTSAPGAFKQTRSHRAGRACAPALPHDLPGMERASLPPDDCARV